MCGLCRRRLQGQWVRGESHFRCRYPSEYAQSAGFDHPVNVYLREADLLPKLDAWLARLVSPANIEATCRRLAAARNQPAGNGDATLRTVQQALVDCQRKPARHRAALEAGGDPAVISQWIAEVTRQQRQAQRILDELRAASSLYVSEARLDHWAYRSSPRPWRCTALPHRRRPSPPSRLIDITLMPACRFRIRSAGA